MAKLQELICTKINHDIIGNVGAVCNAVELLEEDDMEFIDDIKNILKTSSFVLASRLKFFRIVFGSDNAVVDNVVEVAKNYVETVSSKNYPINLNVSQISQENLKLVYLQIMIAAELLVKGGNIDVSDAKIEINGEKINHDKLEAYKNLCNAQETASNSGVLYLAEILKSKNKNLKFDVDDNTIIVEVV